MFDYQVSKHTHFDHACRAFANAHRGNLAQIAEAIGMNPQMLCNKLNPEQPHMLTCVDLMKLTDATQDASILDGLLEQLQCQPSVPVNEICDSNMSSYLLGATAEVGKLASAVVSGGHFNHTRVDEFKKAVNNAIRLLIFAGITISSRLHSNPAFNSAVVAGFGVLLV
ncbi:phage regulatory CII family protein [Photorhabdus luminescens]|uniref:Phage regulatory CII family protein n=1 Tax=Photorhabdus luminescens subsp. sonorensis TaxID=1173677 RepID=A0A5C4RLM4_PHOLU|nr:phage regulatory CII family protein [Photorhabdus luminescens]TNH44417.1 phage regulatory CII family protein [Photorhabdus luminescens subsp. sonorensis]